MPKAHAGNASAYCKRRDPPGRGLSRPVQSGEEPGFFAVLNAPNLEQAKAMAEAGTERLELFDLEVVPVNQFPHF